MTGGREQRDFAWRDADNCHGRIIGYDELRLEQAPPDDAVVGVEVGIRDPVSGGIEAHMVYATAGEAVEAGLMLLEAAWRGWAATRDENEGPVNRMTEQQRWRAHVAACSVTDSTFWVHRDPEHPGHFRATEVETGTTAWGTSPESAMENYFARRHDMPERVS